MANSPATCSADVLSCQLNMAAATSSFASHPWGHNTFLFIVGVTTMPRVLLPSLWERGLRCSGPRGWHGGPPDVSSRSLTPRFIAKQPGLPDGQGLWEETYSILSQHCPHPESSPSRYSLIYYLLNCGFGCLLNGPTFPKFFVLLPHPPYLG